MTKKQTFNIGDNYPSGTHTLTITKRARGVVFAEDFLGSGHSRPCVEVWVLAPGQVNTSEKARLQRFPRKERDQAEAYWTELLLARPEDPADILQPEPAPEPEPASEDGVEITLLPTGPLDLEDEPGWHRATATPQSPQRKPRVERDRLRGLPPQTKDQRKPRAVRIREAQEATRRQKLIEKRRAEERKLMGLA